MTVTLLRPAPNTYDLGQLRALAASRFGSLFMDLNVVDEQTAAPKIAVYLTTDPPAQTGTAWSNDLATYVKTPSAPEPVPAAVYVDAGTPKVVTDTGTVLDLKGPKGDKGDPGLPGLAAGIATALADGLMPAADKAKLDTYPTLVVPPVGIVSPIVAGNSLADFAIATLTVPLGKLAAGQQFAAIVDALVGNGTTAGTLNFWLKVAGTKILTAAVTTTTSAKSNAPARFDARLTVRTAGPTTGTVVAGGLLVSTSPTAALVLPVSSGASAVSVSTLLPVDIVVGFNWTAANASNTATAVAASLAQVK